LRPSAARLVWLVPAIIAIAACASPAPISGQAPAFTVTGVDGRDYSDAGLRAQAKPYILYFYATW